ncbi:DNA primase, partial [Patescibacteria group bacterium]|nr:DNA primase [Patescibacteria group bacterium]
MSSSSVDQIKERLGIVDVVSTYLTLEKAGSNLKAKCPFHNEKTPSFFVSPSRNTFYCFGCGVKGDIFSFVEQFEGLDFKGALKVLSERAGVPLAFESQSVRDDRTRLYELLGEATSYFESSLKNDKKAQAYLVERGLTPETTLKFQIGYARGEWNAVYDHLIGKGYSESEIEKAGLIKLSESDSTSEKKIKKRRYYDRFRGRVMFPIADSSGRVIAFSGRLFPEEGESAKYINSPETILFSKSKVLYGYDKAKYTIRKANFSIVVEGQMDLLMSHQAGFPNTVALSGTALTIDQIKALKRLSSNIVLAYDADQAGVVSSGRSAELALSEGMDVKVATIPSGVDPADLARKGAKYLRNAVRTSKHIVDFYLDKLTEEKKDDRAYGRAVVERVLPFVGRIESEIDRAHVVGKVARQLNISAGIVWEE